MTDERLYLLAAGDTAYVFDDKDAFGLQAYVCMAANLDVAGHRVTTPQWERAEPQLRELGVTIVDARRHAGGGTAAAVLSGDVSSDEEFE